MALCYHPDKNQGNPEAEEMFKEVNNANASLTNKASEIHVENRSEQIDKKIHSVLKYKCFNKCADIACILTGCCLCGFCCVYCCFYCCGHCIPTGPNIYTRPDDLEDEAISTQPQADSQPIDDSQADAGDVVSVELNIAG